MDNHLHIVCLDVPYPPDYGGAFVMYQDIKKLYEAGVKIHLHCFEYGRGESPELNKYCEEVNYYKRNKSFSWIFNRVPYIISSRNNPLLLRKLSLNNYPILLEGIHSTWFLYTGTLKNRKVLVRLHNVEWEYYEHLASSVRNILKRMYFLIESKFLKKYERNIAGKAELLALNEKDRETYENILGAKDIRFLPVFLPSEEVKSTTGKGGFCLYHGNLSVPENEKAVLWLLENVFKSLQIKFVIAGKNPSGYLKKQIALNGKAILVENPGDGQMQELIRDAHIHLLPSFNVTGIKIKLLNALFNGRFVIANGATLDGTGLNNLCILSETPYEFQENIQLLMPKDFTEQHIQFREKLLGSLFNNNTNVQLLSKWLFD